MMRVIERWAEGWRPIFERRNGTRTRISRIATIVFPDGKTPRLEADIITSLGSL